ncbi:MAG: hypothetical protein A2Y76_12620 [Planctomycetes bacterium RBG_13_60_9]|nr:MAG: hypothetical protein A2Y76_12620 [Planctomycetes bacterium RBG_13_60_9]
MENGAGGVLNSSGATIVATLLAGRKEVWGSSGDTPLSRGRTRLARRRIGQIQGGDDLPIHRSPVHRQ